MSRNPQTQANLLKARAVLKAGFTTRIHALPVLKEWLDAELRKGGRPLSAMHREAVIKFSDLDVPSLRAMQSYVTKHFEKTVMTLAPWQPDYLKHMKELEAYETLIWWAKECKANYIKAQAANIRVRGNLAIDWGDRLNTALNDLLKWEIQLKLRDAVPLMPGATFNQFNQINNNAAPDAEKVEQIIEEADIVADYLRGHDQLVAARNGAIVRYEDENTVS